MILANYVAHLFKDALWGAESLSGMKSSNHLWNWLEDVLPEYDLKSQPMQQEDVPEWYTQY
jgi:hypothetical protein